MPRSAVSPPGLVRRMACWDWPTLGLFGGVLIVWAAALTLPAVWGPLALLLLILALTLHSSLSHELLHGHPFGAARAETALGLWQPGLFVPYLRFKRTHLAHHKDANLTDPYDDPESAYLDPAVWAQLPRWRQVLLGLNNTLAGRIVLGPVVGMLAFVGSDIRAARAGDHQITRDWLAHIPGVLLTLWAVYLSPLSVWLYLLACYGALGMLKIRTFLEHQAHARTTGRTAIVEDAGLLGFLFLNNNLHVIHHMHPQVAWYKLWPLYRANRARYIARNGGYVFRSYRVIFRQYLWRVKEPVAHPLWRPRGD